MRIFKFLVPLRYYCIVLFFTLKINVLCAQNKNINVFIPTQEIGGAIGSATYIGDLNPTWNFKKTMPAISGVYRYNFNPYVSLRAGAAFGWLRGADSVITNAPYQVARNLSFKTHIAQLDGQIELHFKPFVAGSPKNAFTPYLTSGITLLHFSPKATYKDDTYKLQEIGTEGQANTDFTGNKPYKKIQLAIPLGGGIKYWLGSFWTFYAEATYRHTFTDYLDDVSTVYQNKTLLGGSFSDAAQLADRSDEVTSPPIGIEGKQRGNITNKDGYFMVNVGLTYTLFSNRCPTSH